MSDETARQIEYLIEITQQDIPLKAGLLADVVEGEILVSEMLQDIKLDVADIKLGLFSFFEEEQLRFKIQQNQDKEANFRRLEELRELSRGLTAGNLVGGVGGTRGAADDGGGGSGISNAVGAVAEAVAGSAAAGFAGRTANLLLRRIPQLAIVAGAIAAGVDYFAEYETQLKKFKEEGIDPDTAMKEAAAQAAGELAADFSDVLVEPVANLGLDLIADELGMVPAEIEKLRKEIENLSEAFHVAGVDLIDAIGGFFGLETSIAAERRYEDDITRLRQSERFLESRVTMSEDDVATARDRQSFLSRQLNNPDVDEDTKDLYRKELDKVNRSLAPTMALEDTRRKLADVEEMAALSQAGFERGNVVTPLQRKFANEISSTDKEEFFEDNIEPLVKQAIDSGAVDTKLTTAQLFSFLPGADAVPVVIKDLQALKELSADQLDALLINDDILLRSKLQAGALDRGDRKVIEELYIQKINVSDSKPTSPNLTNDEIPQLDLGGTIEPGQAAIVGEKGPELVLGPAQVIGREDTARVLTPSPTISAAVPVNEMSSNMLAMSSAPVIISTTQGGSTVTNMVNNNSTNVIGGGSPARSSDVGHRRLQDRMQGVV